MKKKLIKRIAVITFFFVTGFSIIGCSHESVPNKNNQTPSVTQSISVEEKIQIIKDGTEIGQGPLTKENVSLAGIHIGDSQEQVLKLYGEPTKKFMVNSTPYLGWYYENLGLNVTFYRRNAFEPVEGIVNIHIEAPSKLSTNTGIGIGDSLESILNKYTKVYGFMPDAETKTQDIFINGVNKWESKTFDVIYYPKLAFLLKNDQIMNIRLTNNLPSPIKG